jgi:ABC-type transporter Mla subunit MlaD
MAAEDTGVHPDEARQKVVWGYIAKVTLWVSLLISGLALERLGLTSSLLSGVVPGEVQTLRADIAQTSKAVSELRAERDTIRVQIGYIAEAPDQLEQCLNEIKQIEANLPGSPAAKAP